MPDGLTDTLVPAFDGYNYVGNGANDALIYLRDATSDGDGLTLAELDALIDNRPPTNDIDWAAFWHDVGTINPETGLPYGTVGQVLNDLHFTGASLTAFFSDPIGNMFGLATAAFGIVAAGYHALVGFANDIATAVRNVVDRIVGAIRDLFDPVVLDLDGDGVELVGLDHSDARFDFDGDGLAEETGWVGADDGLLVFDANGDGVIDAADEVAFVSYLAGAETDLEGLAAFDTDGDGMLTEADAEGGGFDWSQFQVWQDANQNGRSDEGELISLSAAGIVSINLALNGDASEVDGNLIHNTTTFTRADGTTGAAADVSFEVRTHAVETVNLNDNVTGVATDLGASMLFIGAGEDRINVTGTDRADLIMFSQMDDVFLVSGGDGYDRVVFGGDVDPDNIRLVTFEEDGLIGVQNTETGESFFLAADVESLTIGGQTYELGDLWA